MQDFHIYYSSADIFSHIHMHGSAVTPLHSQTENKRDINLKKMSMPKNPASEVTAVHFSSLFRKSQSWLIADVSEVDGVALDLLWIQTLEMWPTGVLELCLPMKKNTASDIWVEQEGSSPLLSKYLVSSTPVSNSRRKKQQLHQGVG